jgi:DedD protein
MASQKAGQISAAEMEMKRRGRRRLIGAIAIGLLAIVFLPMIFDSKPKETKPGSSEISIQIPPKEGLPPLPPPVAAGAAASPAKPQVEAPKGATSTPPPPAATATVAPPAPAPTTLPAQVTPTLPVATATVTPAKAPAKVEPAPSPAPAKAEPPKVVTKAEPVPPVATAKPAPPQSFVVQIGAFRDVDSAQQVAAKAKELKLPVFTDSVATANGKVTRVRVGPFTTREKADSALVQVKLSGADGKIVPLQ